MLVKKLLEFAAQHCWDCQVPRGLCLCVLEFDVIEPLLEDVEAPAQQIVMANAHNLGHAGMHDL